MLDPVSKEQTEPIHTVVADDFASKTVINYFFGWRVSSSRKVNACCSNMRSQQASRNYVVLDMELELIY